MSRAVLSFDPRAYRGIADQAFRRYVVVLLAATIGAAALWVGGSVLLMRTGYYVRSSTYAYDIIAEQRFALSGASHELLVIGDSSALRGVVAADVTRMTGLDTYNAALYGISGLVSYDQLLAHYLAHNAAPRLLVLYVTETEPALDRNHGSYERTLIQFRYGSLADIAAHIVDSPGSVFWPEAMLRKTMRKRDWRGRYHDAMVAGIERSGGYVGPDEPALSDDCDFDSRTDLSGKDELVAFRRKWAERIKDVAIYLAPMPACDRSYAYFVAQYQGIADNAIARLPGHLFVDYTHASAEGAHETSRLLAEFVNRRRQNWK